MSKITKQDLQFQINRLYAADSTRHNQMLRMQRALSSLGVDIMSDEFDKPSEPKLKQIDQSIFDGLDEEYCFAAIDAMGRLMCSKTQMMRDKNHWIANAETSGLIIAGVGYETTDWKNSLIERKAVLTGSDLCRAMLARGDKYVMCRVSDIGDSDVIGDITHVIRGFSQSGFKTKRNTWLYAVPINNQGEPLTAKEVGL